MAKRLILEWTSRDGEKIEHSSTFGIAYINFHPVTKKYRWTVQRYKGYPYSDGGESSELREAQFASEKSLMLFDK